MGAAGPVNTGLLVDGAVLAVDDAESELAGVGVDETSVVPADVDELTDTFVVAGLDVGVLVGVAVHPASRASPAASTKRRRTMVNSTVPPPVRTVNSA
jgi:hypothetical protein